MSSVTSSFAQISGRVKFFLGVVADISGYVVAGLNSVSPTNSALNPTDIIAGAVDVNLGGAGILLKDLGRQIVLYEAPLLGSTLRSPHVATYRQVQVMNGPTTEGVDGSAPDADLSYYRTYYVCVSSANQVDHPVKVVRTG